MDGTREPRTAAEDPETRLFRAVQGHYEVRALLALWRTGLLQRALNGECLRAGELSADGYDEENLTALLDYLTVRGLLSRVDGGYRPSPAGESLTPYLGYLGTMVGAYEPVMVELEGLVTGRKTYGADVRRSVTDLAGGLTSLEDNLLRQFHALLPDRPFTKVMDLGCGSARMLCRVVRSRPGVTGVGVDADDHIRELAGHTVAEDGLTDRVTIVRGDAGRVSAIPASVRAGVDLVIIMFVLHELLRQRGRDGILDCLREIGAMLGPGGTLLAVEVESLGTPQAREDMLFTPEYEFLHTLTHQRLATRAVWTALAEGAGFHVERIEPLRMCRSFCMVLSPHRP